MRKFLVAVLCVAAVFMGGCQPTRGMVWAGVGMLASSFTGSRYVAYLSPFIVYYLLIIMCERYFLGIRVLYPKEWMNPGEWWPMGRLGVVVWLAELSGLIVLAFRAQGEKKLESV